MRVIFLNEIAEGLSSTLLCLLKNITKDAHFLHICLEDSSSKDRGKSLFYVKHVKSFKIQRNFNFQLVNLLYSLNENNILNK